MKYKVNLFEIDTTMFSIKCGAQPVPVEPKVFDLIIYLIENRHILVSRETLFNKVWAGRDVSDTTLSNHIKSARKALGDNGEQQLIIKTIRGRGYQFIGEVTESTDEPVSSHKATPKLQNRQHYPTRLLSGLTSRHLILPFLLLCLGVLWWLKHPSYNLAPERPYVLVLPFEVSGIDAEKYQTFADQSTREVIQKLRKISGLNVVPATSSFMFKENKSHAYIKNKLPSIRYILSANINMSTGARLQISPELDDLNTGSLVWSKHYQSRLDDTTFFTTQAKVAESVSKALKIAILENEKVSLAKFPTANLRAYEYYIEGQHKRDLLTHADLLTAIDLFSEAIKLDPEFEAAYLAKADAYRLIMAYFDKPADVLPFVIESVAEVLKLNPNSAQARASLGLAYVLAWRWEDAWSMLIQAQNLDSNLVLTEIGFALYYSAMGNVQGVFTSLEQANQIDPLNIELADWGHWALAMMGELEAAMQWADKQLQLHPNVGMLFSGASVSASLANQHQRAIRLAQQGVQLDSGAAYPILALAQTYGHANQADKIPSLIEKAKQYDGYLCPYETAITYLLIDEVDKAFVQFNKAVEYRSNCLVFTRNDLRLTKIRNDPRYLALLTRVGLDDKSIMNHSK
ncbi:MAG: winged helix-turn-helix domain-containing protein [Paraglaciecola sp.]|uniref:winged helix-turn-helix domain-containing protein n=1 Tax=Paraglaciecola sp. TaxID=1920173 RepID=UPI0032975167